MKTIEKIEELYEGQLITKRKMHEMKRDHYSGMIEKILDDLHRQAGIPKI